MTSTSEIIIKAFVLWLILCAAILAFVAGGARRKTKD